MNVWISVLLAKYTHCRYVINNLEREFNFSESLKMDIVKMSPLTILLEEKRERRNEEKKSWPFYLLPPSYASSVFFFSFSLILHAWKRREKQKHHYIKNRPMMHSSNECALLFFCYVLKRTSLHTLFSYFFARVAYTARPKQRKARSLSPSLPYSYIYIRNKSHLEFFFWVER